MKQRESHPDDDIHLMLQIGRGDHQAFNELWRKYKPIVVGFLVSRQCPESLLDDLTQEVFLRVWANRKHFRGYSSAKTFLLGIAKNVLKEERRRDRSTKHLSLSQMPASILSSPDLASQIESESYRQQLIKEAKKAMIKLPTKVQEAVELVHISGIPVIKAARISGCSIETFQRRLQRGIEHLPNLLTNRKFLKS